MAAVILNEDEPLAPNDGNLEPTKLETPSTEPAPAPVKEKPSKFAGKTLDDVARMYEELETRFGKQGEEVGELRKLSDTLIRSSLEKQAQPAANTKPEPSATDDADAEFFINPRAAVRKLLEEDETIQDLRKHKTETQQERSLRITLEKHPDANDLVADPEFEKWVKASKIRFDLFMRANTKFDAEAADELFGTYKELRSVRAAQKEATAETDKSIVESQKKAAGAATGTTSSGETNKGKPTFSRRKLMELRINNPDEYEARSDEILAAYAEGRVRP